MPDFLIAKLFELDATLATAFGVTAPAPPEIMPTAQLLALPLLSVSLVLSSPDDADEKYQFIVGENIGVGDADHIKDENRWDEAAEKGIQPGDVIVEFDREAVSEPQQVLVLDATATAEKQKLVLLYINSQGDMRFSGLKLPSEKKSSGDN